MGLPFLSSLVGIFCQKEGIALWVTTLPGPFDQNPMFAIIKNQMSL